MGRRKRFLESRIQTDSQESEVFPPVLFCIRLFVVGGASEPPASRATCQGGLGGAGAHSPPHASGGAADE